ncbi:MAG TPA: OmpH family outer membrane protein, partial [Geobacteraceae bacterium]|nr:OmpH family outer membrane protein [Geobacteraceae bacterium]
MRGFITIFALVLALSLPLAAVAAENGKLGYVDIQKVLNVSNAGKNAKEQLTAKVKEYQADLNRKQDELKKLKDVLEKQGSLLSESAKAVKERDYQQKLKDLQRMQKDAQDDLRAKDEELTRNILTDIEKVVQEYGRKNNYTFIFVRNESMIFVDEKADLTDQILTL